MNLLQLILISFGIIVGVCVFYVAWEISSGSWGPDDRGPVADPAENAPDPAKKEPGESKESKDPPGS